MGTIFVFVGIFLLSLFAATLVAQSFAVFFLSREEFIGVLFLIPLLALIDIVAFAIAYRFGGPRAIAWTAIGLLSLIVLLLAGLGAAQAIASHAFTFAIGAQDIAILLELVIPALAIVLAQWGMVRRRWLKVHGLETLSAWPWVATVVAALVALNPFGLAVLGWTLGHSAADMLWDFFALIAAGATAALIAMAAVEYYVRARIVRRRLAAAA